MRFLWLYYTSTEQMVGHKSREFCDAVQCLCWELSFSGVIYLRRLKLGIRLPVRMRNRYVQTKTRKICAAGSVSDWIEIITRMATHIEDDIGHDEAKVAPVIIVEDIEIVAHELIRSAGRAEGARVGSVLVDDVAACRPHVRAEEHAAALTGGRDDGDKLDGRAVDVLLADGLAEECFDEVGVRRQTVHPAAEESVMCRTTSRMIKTYQRHQPS